MNLIDLVHRASPPEPWAEGDKIPWNDPDFSRRMLPHLSQAHDAASRRRSSSTSTSSGFPRGAQQPIEPRARSGLRPRLYTSRLAQRGHTCVGIDFSPASIEYARDFAQAQHLACDYQLDDLRHAEYGTGYDLAMFIFGELNLFRPAEAQHILRKAYAALNDGGHMLLEVQPLQRCSGRAINARRGTRWNKGCSPIGRTCVIRKFLGRGAGRGHRALLHHRRGNKRSHAALHQHAGLHRRAISLHAASRRLYGHHVLPIADRPTRRAAAGLFAIVAKN